MIYAGTWLHFRRINWTGIDGEKIDAAIGFEMKTLQMERFEVEEVITKFGLRFEIEISLGGVEDTLNWGHCVWKDLEWWWGVRVKTWEWNRDWDWGWRI